MPLINKPSSDNSSKSVDEEVEELNKTINVLQLFLRDYVIDVGILEDLHKERLENNTLNNDNREVTPNNINLLQQQQQQQQQQQ